MAECPFIPPFPKPPAKKPGWIRRMWLGRSGWIHTLPASAYAMKMGETRLARVTIYIVNEMALVTRVLDDKLRQFPKHWMLSDLLAPLLGKSLFIANGAEWENQRQMVHPAFVHTNLKRAFAMMAQAAAAMVERMQARQQLAAGGVVDVDPLMTHVTADIIFRTMFSRELGEAEALQVYEKFAQYQKYAQRSTVLHINGLPRFGMGATARKIALEVRALFAPIVAERMANQDGVGQDGPGF
jgi:cytochrome P450